jgi:hypothetical protein
VIGSIDGLGNLPGKLGALAAAYARYWLGLPKRAGVPLKRALDPGAMRQFVANFVIVERHGARHFTWRLAGSGVRELYGIELTGTDALELRNPAQREKAIDAYNAQLDTPCGAWGITVLRTAGGNLVPTEVLALPLRADDGTPRFLGNTVEPCAPERRTDKGGSVTLELLSWREHRFVDIGFGLPRFPRRQP